jgi:anti-sigma28 factor (negative regulator of flagellin synthesis)
VKIDNSGNRPFTGLARPSRTKSARETASGSGSVPSSDRVDLTNLSASLKASLPGSTMRLNKLSALTALAAEGNYGVDAWTVSASIIRHSMQYGGMNAL